MDETHGDHPSSEDSAALARLDRTARELLSRRPSEICFRCYTRVPIRGPFCESCWGELERARGGRWRQLGPPQERSS